MTHKHFTIKGIHLNILAALIVVSGFSSCKTASVTTEAPVKAAAPAPVFQRKLSNINVPIKLPMKPLEDKVNQTLGEILYEDRNIKDDHYELRVQKIGRVTINARDNSIQYSVPMRIWANAGWEWQPCDICPSVGKTESTEFEVTVSCKTSLSITPNWEVKTKSSIEYQWGAKPKIELGPIKIPLSGILEPVINSQIDRVAAMLDAEMTKRVPLRSMVQNAWNDLQKPILLDEAMNTWLKITPVEIRASNISAVRDEVAMKVGIRSYIETFSGKKPETTINTKLPNLIIDNKMNDQFSVSLSGEMPYEFATKVMKDMLAGKQFDFEKGRYKVKILDLELYGSTDKLTMRMDIDGKAKKGIFSKKIKGSVYAQGLPYYDAATSTAMVKDFEWSFKTKDVLLRSAAWMTKVGFKETIQNMVRIPLKDKIEEARRAVQDGLNKNGRIGNNVQLKGTINSLSPDGIYLTPNHIKAVVTGEGNVNVIIDRY